MRIQFFCLIFLLTSLFFNTGYSQNPGEWMWVHGDSLNGSGNYGVMGVPGPSNKPPPLYECVEWRDLNGNFWMYGGVFGNTFGALWKYDPTTNEWTWMSGTQTPNYPGNYGIKGVTAPSNAPPSKGWGAASWVDLNGDLWMFGGLNGGPYNDLWKYSISLNQWTWMSGSNLQGQSGNYGTIGVPAATNQPGSRTEACAAWTDNSGNLWMFGGYDWGNSGSFNDMWKYDIATGFWTWMKGSTFTTPPPVHGVQGIEAAANTPGGRFIHARWKDTNGNFWIFGGADYTSSDYYNDLWRFNPVTNNWTWMKGSNLANQPGFYGAKCTPTPMSNPGPRMENRATWVDLQGNLWMMGGIYLGLYNDLWKYCIASNEWVWVEGDSTLGEDGRWGTMGVSDPLNKPSSRDGSNAWVDASGKLYLFGGYGMMVGNSVNDLWAYAIDTTCSSCSSTPVAIFTAPSDICPGTCIDFTNNSVNAISYLWNFPGANPSVSTDENPSNICYNTPGDYDVTLIAVNANGSDTLNLSNYITVFPQPPPQGILQAGDTLFANAGSVSYQWYFNGSIIPGATQYFYIAPASGNYNVVVTDLNGCEVEAVINDVIAAVPPLSDGEGSWPRLYPNPVTNELIIVNEELRNGTTAVISIYNVIGEKVLSKSVFFVGESTQINVQLLQPGFYLFEMTDKENIYRMKFFKE